MNDSAASHFVTGLEHALRQAAIRLLWLADGVWYCLEHACSQAAVKPVFSKHRPRTIRILSRVPRLIPGHVKQCRLVATCCLLVALRPAAQAAPLLEEGFPYPPGTSLAANSPWAGNPGASVAVVGGNLTYSNLQQILAAPNNLLAIGGGGSASAYRNFSASPVESAEGVAVYFSALVNCTLAPTNRQFIACLLPAGSTSASAPDDPIDLYMTPATGGCRLAIRSEGSDPATASAVLALNTTHLIVLKYAFGTNDYASLYLDPVPGAPEPAFADASPGGDGGGEDDDGGGGDAPDLQVILFHSPGTAAQGGINFDTVRVGTNWADVTPLTYTVSVTGPQDQSVCYGSPAVFSVTPNGTPPFSYQWRTNGTAMGGATNNAYTNSSPNAAAALLSYDVVVTNLSGSVTSKVAKIIFSYHAPVITVAPVSQVILPGVSNATFTVSAAGDAPLSLQWRTNGIAIPGATNFSYSIANPGPADANNLITVVASNPCGSVTSAPPVRVYFPTSFYAAYDAGAGFFSGENVIFTNAGGISFYAWSSPDLSLSVTNWTLEGPMSELPLGTSGYSRYGINLNPVASPVYYIFATTNTGPYPATEPVVWLTTPDFASFTVTCSNFTISADGYLNQVAFYYAYDAGAGFFSGENVIFTNASGLSLYAWSSPDPAVSVTNWTWEGPMSELPLGASGDSRYGINLNPATSPVYYIFGPANIGNFTPTEPLVWLTTPDFASYSVAGAGVPISHAGIFDFPTTLPIITQPPQSRTVLAGQGASFDVLATGSGLGYQWLANNSIVSGASAPTLNLNNVSAADAGTYAVIVTNLLGSVTSSSATLTVVSPPILKLQSGAAGTIQFNANSLTGLTYVVETATNLANPAWVPTATNVTGLDGIINFQTNAVGTQSQFYRLVFP